jgi:predicted transcriptional regulator
MKTITLKTDDTFFEKVTELSRQLHLTKSELIRRAISEYEETIRRRALKEQIRNASLRVRGQSREINEEFSDTLMDGLDDV